MVAVDAGLLMFGGVAGGDVPFAPECWLLQLGPSPLLGLKENEVTPPDVKPYFSILPRQFGPMLGLIQNELSAPLDLK